MSEQMEQTIEVIDKKTLKDRVHDFKNKMYRLVQISCTALESGYEITYCFEAKYRMDIIRVNLTPDEKSLDSISGLFFASVLYENEIHDLFGVSFDGLTLDFKGNFYQTSIKTPFKIVKKEDSGAKK
jgi:ech hydrogenase subunit D